MTAPTLPHPDDVGEIVCRWTREHGAEVLQAPPVALGQWDIIDSLERDTDDRWVVLLPGDIRYRIGQAHPHQPRTVYLHRLP